MNEENKNQKIEWGLPSIGIPSEVLFNPFLTHTEKMLFGFIRNMSMTKKGCWASNKYLGALLGVKSQTISNGVANLKKYAYVKVIFEGDKKLTQEKKRRIFINNDYQNLYRSLVEEFHEVYNKADETLLIKLGGAINELIYGYKITNSKDVIKDEIKISNELDIAKLTSTKLLEPEIFNKETQIAYSYWLSFKNTPNHRASKVRNEALKDLDLFIKKYDLRTVKKAMNVYNSLLENPFIMITKNAPFKIGLNEFFKWGKYSKSSLSKWKDNPVANIKSWFDVCLLGTEEAERIMTKISKDDNPKITKKLKKEFDNRIEKIRNPEPRDENAFISTSRYIIEFLKTNNKFLRIDAVEKRNPVLFVPYLYDYLKDNQNGNKQHPGWFTNDYFYDNFPVWMIKKGHMTESRKVKRR
ncbi:hypothetical protein LCGC14_0458450 [marine sediment metagenome]|uniref:Uncharacterized protein n=1 Tax=marine sediment metagenome TaxID=412755 RepID=A0A0F9V2G2_9ZZZZ